MEWPSPAIDGWGIAVLSTIAVAIVTAIMIAWNRRPKKPVATADQVFIDMPPDEDLRQFAATVYAGTRGALRNWQRKAWFYGWLHYYTVLWTSLSTLSLPFLVQYVGRSPNARLLVQLLASFAAVIYGLHATFRVKVNFQRFRVHESTVYSLIRTVQQRPAMFGASLEDQKSGFSAEVEKVRDLARNDEIDNTPNAETPQQITGV
jgi:hypothetical protein